MKKIFGKIGAVVGEINNSRVANAVDRFLEKLTEAIKPKVLAPEMARYESGGIEK